MITPEDFKKDVRLWAKKIGVSPKEIILRKMRRELGSCSSKGIVTFDTSLLEEPMEIRLKVIIHELLHLRHQNHGRLFKLLVEAYLREGISEMKEFLDNIQEGYKITELGILPEEWEVV
ncbi:MAG TPA: M48 family peptidase, partial [Methanosarcinales archaeon]|nr:M48 family peptidase [Methanosarcinales archaeon]